ncbi:MAG: cytochrome C oxidase subunit IV family protein [Candidatus Sulfotelmatobacter sp.]
MSSENAKSSPLKMYFSIWVVLLLCTYITYKAAFIELGQFNAAVALGIATLKATLVALFFMHVWHASEKLTKLVVVSALFFLLLLLGLTMTDYATRPWS